MMVYGEAFENDPDYQAGMVEFWCTQTGMGSGPDNGSVDMERCSQADRVCYAAY